MSTFGHSPRFRAIPALLLTLILASACGGAPSGASPSTNPDPSAYLAATAEPDADGHTLTGTVQAGVTAGSATVEPFDAAVIEATGPDGSTYQLAIEPASVRHPTVVSLRPLSSVSIDGATLLAGVDIEPSGLQLFVPAVLTIVPAAAAGPTMPTTLEYTGSSDATIARIASVTPTSSAAGYQLVLTHFSGGIIVSLTPDTETSLFEAFSASHVQPNTPEGRQAQAETGLRTIKWAEEHERMDQETATRRTADYEREWWEAEADRLRDDPGLNTKIKNGDPKDADAISTELARMLEAAKNVQDSGGDANTAYIEATGLAAEYGTNLANHLRSDPAFQAILKSGLVSDVAAITDMLGVLAGLARQLALLGNDEAAEAMIQAWKDFLETMATAIGSKCSEAAITPEMAYGLSRQAAILGQEAAVSALEKCLPTPPPCPEAVRPGLAVTGGAFLAGRAVAGPGPCVGQTLTGTLTFNAKQLHDADYPDGYVTASETTTIQVRLRLEGVNMGFARFVDDGSTLTYTMDYASPGSDPLCDFESHRSVSGTFLDNAGWIATWVGTGADTSNQPIELDYTFSAVTKFMFHGCGPDETATGDISPLGCHDGTVVGVPVASSASGTIFDFGCTSSTLGAPWVDGIWQMTISGTLVLSPPQ